MSAQQTLRDRADLWDNFFPGWRAYGYDAQTFGKRIAYASFVSTCHRFVYVETPKAACTTTKWYLRDLYDHSPIKLFEAGLRESARAMFIHARTNHPLQSLLDLEPDTAEWMLTSNDVFRFCFVRNPYERLISVWANKFMLSEPAYLDTAAQIYSRGSQKASPQDLFHEFMSHVRTVRDFRRGNQHWRLQTHLVFPDAISYTLIGKTEHLTAHVGELASHLRAVDPTIRLPELRRENPSPARYLSVKYTPEEATFVENTFRADFDRFDFPRAYSPANRDANIQDEVLLLEHMIEERNQMLARLYDRIYGKKK